MNLKSEERAQKVNEIFALFYAHDANSPSAEASRRKIMELLVANRDDKEAALAEFMEWFQ